MATELLNEILATIPKGNARIKPLAELKALVGRKAYEAAWAQVR